MTFPTEWSTEWQQIGKLLLAYLLAMPVGWYREKEGRTVGVRTFPLVSVASCGYVLLGSPPMDHAAQSRIIQGLVAGIGFIGGGAILKSDGQVHGTATAASIWVFGLVGALVAMDRFWMAAVLSLLNLITLRLLLPVKLKLDAGEAGRPGQN